MFKTQSLSYSLLHSQGPPTEKKFQYHFFVTVYNFCFKNRYTFIAYAHPPHPLEEDLGKLRTSANTIKTKVEESRKTRIVIAKGRGLQNRPLLDIRELTPSHPGFIFSPFSSFPLSDHPHPTHHRFSFFEAQIIIPIDEWKGDGQTYRGKVRYKNEEEVKAILGQLKFEFQNPSSDLDRRNGKAIYINEIAPHHKNGNGKDNTISTSKKTFCHQVREQVSRMQGQSAKPGLKKIVLSRLKIVPPPPELDMMDLFFRMIASFPLSFVNLVSSPEVGTWMGASPEILVRRDGRKIFQTVSLAGTQWLDPKKIKPLPQVAWTQKEIEEQAVTSRFIIDCFKKIRLREYSEEGPQTVRKGNLLHLQSSFTVDLKRYYGDSLPYEMIALLHPTPAVGGMPQLQALREIQRVELHDRGYYAGFFGPVEIDQSIDIYVNLRCLKWVKIGGRVRCSLYAGVGLNRFSDPEKEWQETEVKMSWILQALKASKM